MDAEIKQQMTDLKKLLKDEALVKKVHRAPNKTEAIRLLIAAGKARGVSFTVKGLRKIIANERRDRSTALSAAQLAGVAGNLRMMQMGGHTNSCPHCLPGCVGETKRVQTC